MYFTYVLRCIDLQRGREKFYTGITENLAERVNGHGAKAVKTTKSFNELELIYYEACLNKADAIHREKQLKTGFGRGYLKRRLENYFRNAGVV